jgi:hypothetical protein
MWRTLPLEAEKQRASCKVNSYFTVTKPLEGKTTRHSSSSVRPCVHIHNQKRTSQLGSKTFTNLPEGEPRPATTSLTQRLRAKMSVTFS